MIWIFRQGLYLLYKGLCLGLRVEMGGLSAVNQQAYLSRLKGGIIDTISFLLLVVFPLKIEGFGGRGCLFAVGMLQEMAIEQK